MRLASQVSRPSWTGLFTAAVMALQTVSAVELDVENDGGSISTWNYATGY